MSKVLVIQRGHVARTTGATGAPGEQAMAIRNAAEIIEICKALPDVTPMVIDADVPNLSYTGDYFIALHADASANKDVQKASVGFRNDEGRFLGQRWKTLYERGGWKFGFMRDNYTINLEHYYGTGHAVSAGNPKALIVEHGFMTNDESRAFIESDEGVKLSAATAISSCFLQYDLDRLLKNAPKPPAPPMVTAPPSTEGSDTTITYGDRGRDVRAWQQDLIRAGYRIPAGATGNFLEQTVAATNAFYRATGLTSRDPKRPVVGARSRAKMAEVLRTPASLFGGKRVVAKVDVRYYRQPGWHPSIPFDGILKPGWSFRGGIRRIVNAPGGGTQYEVFNSNGDRRFITTNPKFVSLI